MSNPEIEVPLYLQGHEADESDTLSFQVDSMSHLC